MACFFTAQWKSLKKYGKALTPNHFYYSQTIKNWVIENVSGNFILKGFRGYFLGSKEKLSGIFGGKTYTLWLICSNTKWEKFLSFFLKMTNCNFAFFIKNRKEYKKSSSNGQLQYQRQDQPQLVG